jgi:phenylpropionate dioxygenase-like ring-hydroxylating dioxygenase large terminal subunit
MSSPSPVPTSKAVATLPPGPPASWLDRWYAVAFLKDLDPLRPLAFTLLDQDLVIWWDGPGGTWRAFEDVCPHRLVPLSEGRINAAGALECPYHGWTFDGSGQCLTIPQESVGASHSPARSCARRRETATGQGLLFVFAGAPAGAALQPLPLVPELEEPRWLVQDTFRDLPYDALTLLENVLDVSHVSFTHHATVGRRENAGPVELELTAADADGFQGLWREGPRRGKLGSQHTTFLAPALMWHDLSAPGFARILTVVYATPIRRGECRLFARFPFQFESPWPARLLGLRPVWLQHLGNHRVLEDDQIFLHWQERVLARRGGSEALVRSCYLATAADRYVQALHDWVLEHGGVPFPGQPLPPRLGDGALLDRWQSHSRHCRSCRGADLQLRRIHGLTGGLAALALVMLAWSGATVAALPWLLTLVVLLGLRWKVGLWRRALRVGERLPARNRPA